MIKLVALIVKRADLSSAAFRDYYEQRHAPLIVRLSPSLAAYRRSYVDHASLWRADRGEGLDIHVITELWFADAEALAAQEEVMRRPDVRRLVAEDEARFMRRDLTRIFRTDETASSLNGATEGATT